jgi:2-polyprenyl-6-hydroxyphenyl methylase/3-demethylubiquinone-9 3-methyltransferase
LPSTVDPKETILFNALSDHWWKEEGPLSTLHKMNPVRLSFIKEGLTQHFEKENHHITPLKGLSVIDVGCGGGILSEPLCRLGAHVTGIDPSDKAVEVAKKHALNNNLPIDYQCTTADALAKKNVQADAVMAIEILEHVRDKQAFINEISTLVKPGGQLFISTLNRTVKSWALGVFLSEYVLRWVPPGTHHWQNFTRPHELNEMLKGANMKLHTLRGMVFEPLKNDFALSKNDFSINYICTAIKKDK